MATQALVSAIGIEQHKQVDTCAESVGETTLWPRIAHRKRIDHAVMVARSQAPALQCGGSESE